MTAERHAPYRSCLQRQHDSWIHFRARLSDLDNWKVQVEAASQHFDGVLGGLRGNWYRLEQRFDQIANRLDHKRTPRAIDSSPYQQQVQQVSPVLP